MFAIIGAAVVTLAIVGGYLMERGNIMVLLQPAEILIIVGAGVGTTLIANPLPVIRKLITGIASVFKPSRYDKAFFTSTLKMLYDPFVYARKNGMVKLETDIEEPEKSGVFTKYPEFLNDRQA